MADTRRYSTAAWELEVPAGILGRAVEPPPDSPYDSMFILRGWLHDDAPATLVVTTRRRMGVTLRSEARGSGPASSARRATARRSRSRARTAPAGSRARSTSARG